MLFQRPSPFPVWAFVSFLSLMSLSHLAVRVQVDRKRLNSINSSSDVVSVQLLERRGVGLSIINTSCFLCGGDLNSQTWQMK